MPLGSFVVAILCVNRTIKMALTIAENTQNQTNMAKRLYSVVKN